MRALGKYLGLAVASLICSMAIGCGKKSEPAAPPPPLEPKISIAEMHFDFGEVQQGEVVEHVFEVINQGKAPLEIKEARGSCGCLAVVEEPSNIPPGGKGQVKLSFRTAGRQGKQDKKIFISSNDPKDPKLTISVTGQIRVDVAAMPQSIWMRELKKGEKASREFALTVAEPDKIKITAVKIDDKRFAIKLKSGEPASSAQYELQFNGGSKVEIVSTEIMVGYEGGKVPQLRIPVRAEVVGDLRYPRSVQVYKKNDKWTPAEVLITSRSNKMFQITKIEDEDKQLKFEIEQAKGPNARFRAEIADPNASHQAMKRYSFVVETTNRDEPKLTIAYVIYDKVPEIGEIIVPRLGPKGLPAVAPTAPAAPAAPATPAKTGP